MSNIVSYPSNIVYTLHCMPNDMRLTLSPNAEDWMRVALTTLALLVHCSPYWAIQSMLGGIGF